MQLMPLLSTAVEGAVESCLLSLSGQGICLASMSEISRHSRGYMGQNHLTLLLTILGILIIIAAVSYAVNAFRTRTQVATKAAAQQQSLMKQLVAGLQLSALDEILITEVAARSAIQPPEVLFIDAALWEPCLNTAAEEERELLLQLMEKLFGPEHRHPEPA